MSSLIRLGRIARLLQGELIQFPFLQLLTRAPRGCSCKQWMKLRGSEALTQPFRQLEPRFGLTWNWAPRRGRGWGRRGWRSRRKAGIAPSWWMIEMHAWCVSVSTGFSYIFLHAPSLCSEHNHCKHAHFVPWAGRSGWASPWGGRARPWPTRGTPPPQGSPCSFWMYDGWLAFY